MMPGGRGSSSGGATLAEALRLGNGPAGSTLTVPQTRPGSGSKQSTPRQ